MNAAQQGILAQWHQAVEQAAAELQELLRQASAGCQVLVRENPTDLGPLDRALAAIGQQAQTIRFRPGQSNQDAYDRLQAADPDDRASAQSALAEMERERRAFDRWADEAWRRLDAHWHIEQLRAMWPHVEAAMARPVPCNRCGAALQRTTPRASESITCAACGGVNQALPDPVVAAYFHLTPYFAEPGLIGQRIALTKLKDDWDDYRDAEYAAGRVRPEEPLERLQQREQMELAYWTAYHEPRVRNQGGSAADVKTQVDLSMKQRFYDQMNRNDVWRAAHAMPSIEELTTVPPHLVDVDEWGPLDPSQNPNALEDDMVHDLMLRGALGQPDEFYGLLRALGYRDPLQRAMTHNTFRRHYDHLPRSPESRAMMEMNAGNRASAERMRYAAASAGDALMAPVEGVSLQLYGSLAGRYHGCKPEEFARLLAQHQLDYPKWERVMKGWGERMARDPSGAVSAGYTEAFAAPAPGTEMPSFETFCEIQGAWAAWGKQGKDGTASLSTRFHMTPAEFSKLAVYWTQQMMTQATLAEKFTQLVAQFEQRYLALP